MVDGVPLSKAAKKELRRFKEDYSVAVWVTVFFGFVGCFVALIDSAPDKLGGGWDLSPLKMTSSVTLSVVLVVAIVSQILYHTKGRARRKDILHKNAIDHARAENLQTKVFPRFAGVRSDNFAPREGEVSGHWRPFRVEHFVSQSLRGDISGQICLDIKSFFLGRASEVSAELKQLSVPDLLDMSSVVFFENDAGETMRVLVPSPRATKESLVRLIEVYLGEPAYGTYHGGLLNSGTHVHEALRQFTTDETTLLAPISHPAILDQLDLATQKSLADRPSVGIIGELVQEGVSLATGLVVEGKKHLFVASGYLGELASSLAFAVHQDRRPLELTDTVK